MTLSERKYLGDGLYVHDDGFMVTLIAPRSGNEHYVCLEPDVLDTFIRFLETSRGCVITVERAEGWEHA